MVLDIIKSVNKLNNVVISCIKDNTVDVETLWLTYTKLTGSDEEKKMAVDQCFIIALHNLIKTNFNLDAIYKLLNLIIQAVEKELCTCLTLFIGLTDVLDVISLEECDHMFLFIEERVDVWKSDLFYNSGRNHLLRMCNDLLRRLSKSQNTIFCGRIQLFLARLFPLEERSGLNLMSQFNIENVTNFSILPLNSQNEDEKIKDNMLILSDQNLESKPIDYNLYSKLWGLQNFFTTPTLCYEKNMWPVFLKSTESILTCFKSFKLDDVSCRHSKNTKFLCKDNYVDSIIKMNDYDPLISQKLMQDNPYFAKYLTSEKLIDLQLSDSNFRRNILIQFLITFQYLTAPVKSKTSNQILNEDQLAVVDNFMKQVYNLLEETPPDGKSFSKTILHILIREENWNSWKNEGCVNYIRKKEDPKKKKVPTATLR